MAQSPKSKNNGIHLSGINVPNNPEITPVKKRVIPMMSMMSRKFLFIVFMVIYFG
jgi:hypothetical protein